MSVSLGVEPPVAQDVEMAEEQSDGEPEARDSEADSEEDEQEQPVITHGRYPGNAVARLVRFLCFGRRIY